MKKLLTSSIFRPTMTLAHLQSMSIRRIGSTLYIPLPLRLTCFFLLVLAAALFFFGNTVYQTAQDNAYRSLDELLKSRAQAVWLGKGILATGTPTPLPSILPGIKEEGSDGVAIRVFRLEHGYWLLIASTSQDPSRTLFRARSTSGKRVHTRRGERKEIGNDRRGRIPGRGVRSPRILPGLAPENQFPNDRYLEHEP